MSSDSFLRERGSPLVIRVRYEDPIFICNCSFAERHVPRRAGFYWTSDRPYWHTEEIRTAAKLREYFDPTAKKQTSSLLIKRSPWLSPPPYPSDLDPYPFQLESARYALSQSRSYLALDPGLGKTIIAAMILNALKRPAVFIVPPFLARNTEAELRKWCSPIWSPRIVRFDSREAPIDQPDILIVPDSMIHRPYVRREIGNVVEFSISLAVPPVLIVDEAHRYKTETAARSKALFKIAPLFRRQVYLSGTPMPNRPIELYPILSKVAPETIDFMSKDEYAKEFCAAYWDEEGYGLNMNGASNLPDLQKRVIGPFMIRLRKKDVLKDLPPKTEELIIIGDRPARLIGMESKLLRAHSPDDLMAGKVSSDHVATYRRELGQFKLKPALDFISSLLEDSDESLLVFAYHKDVIAGLVEKLNRFRPLVITGKTPKEERHESVKTFQTDPKRRLFIGNYLAAGLGLTLTKATRVIFVEFSWVPAENDQASDRAHRIGQKDHVFVQYLIYENSIDKVVMETNLKKRKITRYI